MGEKAAKALLRPGVSGGLGHRGGVAHRRLGPWLPEPCQPPLLWAGLVRSTLSEFPLLSFRLDLCLVAIMLSIQRATDVRGDPTSHRFEVSGTQVTRTLPALCLGKHSRQIIPTQDGQRRGRAHPYVYSLWKVLEKHTNK